MVAITSIVRTTLASTPDNDSSTLAAEEVLKDWGGEAHEQCVQCAGSAVGGLEKILNRFETKLCGTDLLPVSKYLFSGTGKNIRPRIISAMAGAVNAHHS